MDLRRVGAAARGWLPGVLGQVRLPIHNPALHARKPGLLQKPSQLYFRKPQPRIRIHLAGLLETMLLQIQNHNPPTGFQQRMRSRDCPLRMQRMMQALTKKREIQTPGLNGRRFQIPQPVFQIRDAVLLRQLRPKLHHLL
jgi:hypothetical protein